MFGLVVLLCVLCTASLLISFLTLACAGRIALNQRQAVDALIDGHNTVAQRVSHFDETLESAMECLLTLDANADSSAEVNAAE
jgi:hypothetical protein